jgi:hypothetical protein
LAANINASVLSTGRRRYESQHRISVPEQSGNHWRGIRARLCGFEEVRAARISSDRNPAHPLANAPGQYAHVNDEAERCVRPSTTSTGEQIPPPSRSDRGASD